MKPLTMVFLLAQYQLMEMLLKQRKESVVKSKPLNCWTVIQQHRVISHVHLVQILWFRIQLLTTVQPWKLPEFFPNFHCWVQFVSVFHQMSCPFQVELTRLYSDDGTSLLPIMLEVQVLSLHVQLEQPVVQPHRFQLPLESVVLNMEKESLLWVLLD